jgi:hypothetical protein
MHKSSFFLMQARIKKTTDIGNQPQLKEAVGVGGGCQKKIAAAALGAEQS